MKDDQLGMLYDLLLQNLIERIKSGQATSADLNVARQLLKDSDIQTTRATNPDINNLLESLPFSDE